METIEQRLSRIVNNVPEGVEWPPVRRQPIVLHDAEPKPFDRAEHCRRIASSGGHTTADRYGSRHMSNIGKIGYAVACQKHGKPRMQEILKGKGWTRSQVSSFREDMAAVGR